MSAPWTQWLAHSDGPIAPSAARICLLLLHNEAHLLPDLFEHYRAMGDLHFIVVDDHSTDGTADLLRGASDVTVFRPIDGSTYARDKREWRGSLLDALAVGKWCLVIDADERLVWRGYPDRSLDQVIADLEASDAHALVATMLDMYAECPIEEHVVADRPLREAFAFYDDPRKDPLAYRGALTPKSMRRRFPLPNAFVMGGMRSRLFEGAITSRQWLTRWLQRDALKRPRHIPPTDLLKAEVITRLTRPRGTKPPLNLTKVPLVKWQAGLRYNGGAHHVSHPLTPAGENGVLLHYPITRGVDGIAYLANRGQHAQGGAYYQSILDKGPRTGISPVYFGTSRLTTIAELEPFFGEHTP